ncbi:ABC1 kinase family protein [Oceaniglobus roseus]|uniref:ABC1 kinase family protein n=1 Tax=Oceaniglobus roseus TaxID=1737570 RepID=UPI000C7F30D1|nr:AarF/ABC1/UbiB kinase family protein [Kandeliimicrobium roseum]
MAMDQSGGRPLAVPSGRIARLARLGSMVGGIAGDVAWNGARSLARGQRPGFRRLLMTPANARRFADDLARMRGAAMKIGQLISMDTGDVLPPELAEVLARLRNDAHFMPPAQLKRVLDAEWGTEWRRAFARFDVRPMAAASIGQVHRAQLKDGRDLAVKVQYPGVARSIDSDVSNVAALVRMAGLVPEGFDLAPYLAEARRQLHEETDYLAEAAQMTRFGALLAGDPAFAVPQCHADWSTPRVLAMSFAPGEPIESVAARDPATRERVTGDLVGLVLRELFDFGLMQTDPNFANYRFDPASGRIVLLDFGATRAFGADTVAACRQMMAAGLADDAPGIAAAAEAIGVLGPAVAPRHRSRILAMIGMVFDELRGEGPFDFTDTALTGRMRQEGIALAEDGFVPPPLPMDVLYLQRKLGGMFLLGARLGARVAVRPMLEARL